MSTDTDINFILGLIAGEGSFNANMHQQDTYKFGVRAGMRFHLGMHSDDRELIQKLQDFFGYGRVVVRDDSKSLAYWEIRNNDNIEKFAGWVENNANSWFKETRKYRAFERWNALLQDRKELIKSYDGMVEFVNRAKAINTTNRGKSADEWVELLDKPKDL